MSAIDELPPAADDPASLVALLDADPDDDAPVVEGMDIEGDIELEGDIDDIGIDIDGDPLPEPAVAAPAAEVLPVGPGEAFVAGDPHPLRASPAARTTAGSVTAGRRVRRTRV